MPWRRQKRARDRWNEAVAQWKHVRENGLEPGPRNLVLFGHIWVISAILTLVFNGWYGSCVANGDSHGDSGEDHPGDHSGDNGEHGDHKDSCDGLAGWRFLCAVVALIFFGLFLAQIAVNVRRSHFSQLPQESGVYVYDEVADDAEPPAYDDEESRV